MYLFWRTAVRLSKDFAPLVHDYIILRFCMFFG